MYLVLALQGLQVNLGHLEHKELVVLQELVERQVRVYQEQAVQLVQVELQEQVHLVLQERQVLQVQVVLKVLAVQAELQGRVLPVRLEPLEPQEPLVHRELDNQVRAVL